MVAAIEAEIGVSPKLVKGGGGVFDVVVNGRTIFSKHEAGRFPDDDEIVNLLKE